MVREDIYIAGQGFCQWGIFSRMIVLMNDIVWLWFFCTVHKSLGCDSIDFDAVGWYWHWKKDCVCPLLISGKRQQGSEGRDEDEDKVLKYLIGDLHLMFCITVRIFKILTLVLVLLPQYHLYKLWSVLIDYDNQSSKWNYLSLLKTLARKLSALPDLNIFWRRAVW